VDFTAVIRDQALREVIAARRRVRVADVPTFDEWVSKKKFKNPKTKQDVTFQTLEKNNPDAAKKIREQYNKAVQEHEGKKEKWDEEMPIKQQWLESKAAWEKRVKESNDAIDAFTAEQFDSVFSDKVSQALQEALKDEPGHLENLAELESGTPIDEMDPPNVRLLKQSLDRAIQKFPKEKVVAYHKVFGDSNPKAHLAKHLSDATKKQKRVEEIHKELEGETNTDKISKLEAEHSKLLGEMEDADAKVQEALDFMKENGALVTLKTQHQAVIEAARGGHKQKLKDKADKSDKQEKMAPVKEAPKKKAPKKDPPKRKAPTQEERDKAEKDEKAERMAPTQVEVEVEPDEEPKEEPKSEDKGDDEKGDAKEESPVTPKDDADDDQKDTGEAESDSKGDEKGGDADSEHQPGDVWGRKPKLYAKNPKGEVGGPFKGMNEAKRWSQGKPHSEEEKAQAERTREEQQKAKKRKKRGSVEMDLEAMITRLATEFMLARIVAVRRF
jgi:hypothetical protein